MELVQLEPLRRGCLRLIGVLICLTLQSVLVSMGELRVVKLELELLRVLGQEQRQEQGLE